MAPPASDAGESTAGRDASVHAVMTNADAGGAGPAPRLKDGFRRVAIDAARLKVIERDSGPINYYSVVNDREGAYIHSSYRYPYKTAVLGYAIPDDLRRRVARIEWRWRAITLPTNGNECIGPSDSAAVFYLLWRRGLRWYTLKYVWSTSAQKGSHCDHRRNVFQAQDTIVLESGPSNGVWRDEAVDPDFEFRKFFENGDPQGDVPDLGGIGIMSDGDQSKSNSEADFGEFVIVYR